MSLNDWDARLTLALNASSNQHAGFASAMREAMHSSVLLTCGAGVLLIWFVWQGRRAIFYFPYLVFTIAITDFSAKWIKLWSARPRPCMVLQTLITLTHCGAHFSFPSNHAVNTAAIAAFLQMVCPRIGWMTWPLVIWIGWGRILMGAHYISDVLLGWGYGVCIGILIGKLALYTCAEKHFSVP